MMRKVFLFFISLIFFFSNTVFAQSPEEIYRNANASYENEDYEHAVSFYEALVEMDKVSPEVFYNLGNSFFKLKKIGRAIVNYERASRLAPRDKDIALNLRLAKSLTTDKIEMPDTGFIVNIFLLPYNKMNIDELTIFLLILYFAIVILLIFYIFFVAKRTTIFYTGGAVLVIFLIFTIFLVSKIRYEIFVDHAVVISDKTDVRSGPKDDYLLQFTLHEGTEVRVVEERQGWYEVELSRDLRGWLPKDSVEVI